MLKINQLSAAYGRQTILKELSFSIEKGTVNTIIGPNGCGKSTLFKLIGKNMKKSKGDIFLQAKNIEDYAVKEYAKKVSLLPQGPSAPEDYTVRDLIQYGRQPHLNWRGKYTKRDYEIVDWAIKQTKLSAFEDRYLATLSGGERQRAWISMALAQQTELILLDEPTTYLDIAHQFELLELIKQLNQEMGITFLMVLHDLNQAARYSDQIIILSEGSLFRKGNPSEVINQETLEKVFNMKVEIQMDLSNNCPYIIPVGACQ